jgi:predicted metal-binding membrane protein
MLVMFAVGTANLGWMLVLGAIMAAEKNLPWGRKIGVPVGVVLTVSGLITSLAGAA